MNTIQKTNSASAAALVHAPPEAVWHVLGDFGNEHKWLKDVKECSRDTQTVHVGTIRKCKFTKPFFGVDKAIETLTEYVPGKSLTYRGHDAIGPFLSGGSRWEITPSSNITELRVTTTVTLKNIWIKIFLWPLLSFGIKKSIKNYAKQLEAYVLKAA